ncbi:MAG: cob(I)yrinic acid a,c-diamide adenosyltransferase [Chloroflexi bacterium]|nr:cob(I)yrinic acid a,c-diamide adenosyltransferase [Chloroflexota bacterium]
MGLVEVYTGDGKGKTTAALGLALRAAGRGLRTYIGQFLKGSHCGELDSIAKLAPFVTVEQYGLDQFVRAGDVPLDQKVAARAGLARARQVLFSGEYDIVVLDEVTLSVCFGLLSEAELVELVDLKPAGVELILTGRLAPQSIIDRADLVTDMRQVRHPYERGIQARIGIEY